MHKFFLCLQSCDGCTYQHTRYSVHARISRVSPSSLREILPISNNGMLILFDSLQCHVVLLPPMVLFHHGNPAHEKKTKKNRKHISLK